jgi:hypothetical protein
VADNRRGSCAQNLANADLSHSGFCQVGDQAEKTKTGDKNGESGCDVERVAELTFIPKVPFLDSGPQVLVSKRPAGDELIPYFLYVVERFLAVARTQFKLDEFETAGLRLNAIGTIGEWSERAW